MKKHNILVSESFSRGKRRYFLDYKIASNRSNYICFIRSDAQRDGTYIMERLRVFQEDFEMLIGSFSSLMSMAAYYRQGYESVQDIHLLNQQEKLKEIKAMDAALRPREKMLENGPAAMTDTELLAMLIGSGTPNESAIDLAYRILGSVEGDLLKLSFLGFPGLCRFAGMGIAKSSSVMAALELGRRLGRC